MAICTVNITAGQDCPPLDTTWTVTIKSLGTTAGFVNGITPGTIIDTFVTTDKAALVSWSDPYLSSAGFGSIDTGISFEQDLLEQDIEVCVYSESDCGDRLEQCQVVDKIPIDPLTVDSPCDAPVYALSPIARVNLSSLTSEKLQHSASFNFRQSAPVGEAAIITDEDIRIEVLLDGVLQETLTGSMSDNFSALVSTETDPNESILDWVLVDSVMSDGATVELDMSQYVGFRGAINPPDVTFNVFVGGSGVNFPIESTNVDNTDTECASIILNAVNAVGTPGTEDGTVTYTNANRIAEYGAGPYQMYRQYTITYSNGLTAVFDTVGTTSNQQMWASQRLDNGFWDFLKTRSGTQATTSNNSNANSKWDAYNEGSTVTYTFSQPIEKLTMLVFDLDQSAQGQIDNISPEADAYWQTAGGIDPPDVNANGVYRWRPTGEDNNMYLYWDSPVTTLTATLNETSNILWNATAIYCEIPPEATIV